LAVTLAAWALAEAAFEVERAVWFFARVRVPFAAERDGALAAVRVLAVRVFERVAAERVVVRPVDLRAVVLRGVLLRAVDLAVVLVVVLVFSAIRLASLFVAD
jgi:hypothetical protein